MRNRYEVNADVGEGFPDDAELMTLVTQANVACGFHAGDLATMRETCRLAVTHGVEVGAQVSYRDRAHFGRRDLDVGHATLVADLEDQLVALAGAAAQAGTVIGYLKPHGALYNRAVVDDARAAAIVEVCHRHTLAVVSLPGSRLLVLAEQAGVATRREFFADRGYDACGHLVPRDQVGAMVTDPATVATRVRQLLDQRTVTSVDGEPVDVEADSICVHGDSPAAVDLARAVRRVLDEAGR